MVAPCCGQEQSRDKGGENKEGLGLAGNQTGPGVAEKGAREGGAGTGMGTRAVPEKGPGREHRSRAPRILCARSTAAPGSAHNQGPPRVTRQRQQAEGQGTGSPMGVTTATAGRVCSSAGGRAHAGHCSHLTLPTLPCQSHVATVPAEPLNPPRATAAGAQPWWNPRCTSLRTPAWLQGASVVPP